MLTKVSAYRGSSGNLEQQLDRALAWELVNMAKYDNTDLSFSTALWIVANFERVAKLVTNEDIPDAPVHSGS